MSTRLALSAALATTAMTFSLAAFEAAAQEGYVASPPAGTVWKSGSGGCVRTGFWTPSMATEECDPDLVPTPAAPPPRAEVAPPPPPPPEPKPEVAPAAPPPPPKAAALKPVPLTLGAAELFAFDRATLTPAGRAKLEKEVVDKVKQDYSDVRVINVNGHTDRLGAAQYNQRLSERRAEAVRNYLVSRGFDGSKIETYGYGKTMPVKSCPDQKNRKAVIECLTPNRRVEIEVHGTRR
ncbi:MAG TPA: OmpA family protein [Burkholderiales bacterium]|nr:OmpA family protein [Burkholderiales bacterium]